jgi:phage terminase small subunit
MKNSEVVQEEKKLTPKQELFCSEYCVDYNATRAAIKAGFSEKTAYSIGARLLKNVEIQNKIKSLKTNLAETSGISALRVLNEHKKIAFSSASDLRDGWISLKQFDSLSEDQKSCIQEISTKTERKFVKGSGEDDQGSWIEEEWVKVKLYDKQKSLDSISKMFGFDAPRKIDLGITDGIDLQIGFKIGLTED